MDLLTLSAMNCARVVTAQDVDTARVATSTRQIHRVLRPRVLAGQPLLGSAHTNRAIRIRFTAVGCVARHDLVRARNVIPDPTASVNSLSLGRSLNDFHDGKRLRRAVDDLRHSGAEILVKWGPSSVLLHTERGVGALQTQIVVLITVDKAAPIDPVAAFGVLKLSGIRGVAGCLQHVSRRIAGTLMGRQWRSQLRQNRHGLQVPRLFEVIQGKLVSFFQVRQREYHMGMIKIRRFPTAGPFRQSHTTGRKPAIGVS